MSDIFIGDKNWTKMSELERKRFTKEANDKSMENVSDFAKEKQRQATIKELDAKIAEGKVKYEQRQKWARENPNWRQDMADFAKGIEKNKKPFELIKNNEGAASIRQIGEVAAAESIAESLRPSVSEAAELPPEEMKKREEFNKKERFSRAIKK